MNGSSNSLAYIPAADRWPLKLARYIDVGLLVAYSYDWLLSVSDECKICQKAGFSRSLVVYFVSRCVHFFLHSATSNNSGCDPASLHWAIHWLCLSCSASLTDTDVLRGSLLISLCSGTAGGLRSDCWNVSHMRHPGSCLHLVPVLPAGASSLHEISINISSLRPFLDDNCCG